MHPLSSLRGSLLLAVFMLVTVYRPPTAASGPFSPDTKDLRVCELAASLTPSAFADYLVSSAVFDIDGDGISERLSVGEEGTAHSLVYRIERADGTIVDLARPPSPEEDWRWTRGKKWLTHDGRSYALRFSGRGTGYLDSITRIMPDFSEQPVCKFVPRVETLLLPSDKDGQSVCSAVRANAVDYLPAARTEEEELPDRGIPGGNAYRIGEAHVDFMNNGQEELLPLVNISSGAGSGCDLFFYDMMPVRYETGDRDILMTMQSIDLADAYPRRTCYDDMPRWFTFGDQQYLETRSRHAESPSAEASEYHWVASVKNGMARKICEATYRHEQPQLIGIWSGSGWRAPTNLK